VSGPLKSKIVTPGQQVNMQLQATMVVAQEINRAGGRAALAGAAGVIAQIAWQAAQREYRRAAPYFLDDGSVDPELVACMERGLRLGHTLYESAAQIVLGLAQEQPSLPDGPAEPFPIPAPEEAGG
jgi:hypothetical protein